MTARDGRFWWLVRWQAALLHGGMGLLCLFCAPPAGAQIQLRDVTRASVVTFRHTDGSCGRGYIVEQVSAGLALFDYDGDGDVDVVVLNSRREPTILRNDSPGKNHWLQIRLRGTKTNRDGVGARVKVTAGDLTQIDEVHSGRGYQSHYGTRLHFGLGSRDRVDRIEVRWIGGGVDVIGGVAVDRCVTITEGGALSAAGTRPDGSSREAQR